MTFYRLDGEAPRLPRSGRYWVADTATVIGKVTLQDDASIWWNAVLRGDNEMITIGAGSNVQDLCMMHTDPGYPLVLGARCTVGHGAILHGCTIGDNVLIGMGATILNGAVIGANSIVGANALVTEGKQFAERSLIVGAPAKAVRELEAAAVERVTEAAERYVGNGRRYAAGLSRWDPKA